MRARSRMFCFVHILLLFSRSALAQSPRTDNLPASSAANAEEPTTIFKHPPESRYWLSGQINVILQEHPSFPAKYSGTNSLKAEGENGTFRVLTLYTGLRITHTTEILFDVESAGGHGLSGGVGLGGYTNLDVVKNPELGSKPYVARVMFHQVIPLSADRLAADPGPLHVFAQLPARRLEFRMGKFSLVDFFDVNSVGGDSHLQFMNWTVDNNGAYDYAADTRGYTWGLIVEYQDRRWGVRFAEALMPKAANAMDLEWNLARARGENLQWEFRPNLFAERAGVVRLLAYVNHANMGSYREAIHAFLAGQEPVPNIEAHRRQGRVKYGFGLNFEQELTKSLRIFGRWGWNDGRNESFVFTEVDRTLAMGCDVRGDVWRRKRDKLGVAFAINAISGDHRFYLALGGHGFMLGDGALNYGREKIVEGYYTLHFWRGIFAGPSLQHINNPGYNKDRGPVLVPSLRLHLDF